MRILVISDVHANLAALDAVLQDAGNFDRIWCLGDVVGYGPEPNECIDRLRSFDLLCLAGNHDLAVVGKVPLWEFNHEAKEAIAWSRFRLSIANREWLQSLQSSAVISDYNVTLVHGSAADPIWEYVYTPPLASASLNSISTRICFCGHTHVPVGFRKPEFSKNGTSIEYLGIGQAMSLTSDRWLINPGSVGQPRDEDPRAAYIIFDTETMTVVYRRVEYSVSTTQNKMKEAKLPGGLIRRLRFGQ